MWLISMSKVVCNESVRVRSEPSAANLFVNGHELFHVRENVGVQFLPFDQLEDLNVLHPEHEMTFVQRTMLFMLPYFK